MSSYKVPVLDTFEFQQPVEDKDLNTPPTPTKGKRYIVGPSPTDAWINHSGDIAVGNDIGWDFSIKTEGFFCWVKDEDKFYYYDGSIWQDPIGVPGPQGIQGLKGDKGDNQIMVVPAPVNPIYPPLPTMIEDFEHFLMNNTFNNLFAETFQAGW